MELARDLDEGPKRLRRAQDGDMSGNASREAFTHQTCARLRIGQLIDIFQIVEKCQMHRAGFVERGETLDLMTGPRRIDQLRFRKRCDLGQRQQRRLFEESRLRHSTRRGPARYSKSKGSVLESRNR